MRTDLFFTDPVDRFQKIVASSASPAAKKLHNPALSPESIGAVIANGRSAGGTEAGVATAVSHHVAVNSTLTAEAAQPIVTSALAAAKDDNAKAQAVSSAVTAVGVAGNVSLSDPVMLGPVPRLIAATLLAVVAILSVVFAYRLPIGTGWNAYVAMIIATILGILGVLVLVMGYKSVTITGSSIPSSRS